VNRMQLARPFRPREEFVTSVVDDIMPTMAAYRLILEQPVPG
jgi:hypothetical protein